MCNEMCIRDRYRAVRHYDHPPGGQKTGNEPGIDVYKRQPKTIKQNGGTYMEFFNQAIDILKILVMALGAGLAVWGVINLLEGYGSYTRITGTDNGAGNHLSCRTKRTAL